MTSDRPYRKGLSDERAISEMENSMNSFFDIDIVETLKEIIFINKAHKK